MALHDSLEGASNSETDGTFRVDYPVPQAVANEDDLITNSARSVKARHYTEKVINKQNNHVVSPTQPQQNSVQGISDSLQAELHLSLDRLSENFYDQDDLDRIKLKSQAGQKHSKVYPTVGELPQAASVGKLQLAALHEEAQSPSSSKNFPVKTVSYADDDDDIHTVVVDDSLSLNDDVKSLNVDDIQMGDSKKHDSLGSTDPYSHLRYNPEWRNEKDDNTPTRKENRSEPYSMHSVNAPSNRNNDESNSLGGAITVHNQEFLRTTDSPVRLSADPTRLLHMNQKYEEEFHRMLELEHQWQDQPRTISSEVLENSQSDQRPKQSRKSNLKQPTSYKTFVVKDSLKVVPSTEYHSQNSPVIFETHSTGKKPPKQQNSISGTPSKGNTTVTKDKRSYAPAPPKAPKSNRDYIELNKIRLGRKSNSASYLEMYSKKNKILEQASVTPKRPQSDVRQKEKKRHSPKREPENHSSYTTNDLSVEDQWKLQARRLKMAREGKSTRFDDTERSALTEVGNSSRPMISPRHFVARSPQPPHGPQHPAQISPKLSSRHSPGRRMNKSPKSDFSTHPAFSPFAMAESPRKGQIFDPQFMEENTTTYEHYSTAQPFLNEAKQYQYSTKGRGIAAFNYKQANAPMHDPEISPARLYEPHHPQPEQLQSYIPSSLMQMEQQEYGQRIALNNYSFPSKLHPTPYHQQHSTPYHQHNYGEDSPDQRRVFEDKNAGMHSSVRNEVAAYFHDQDGRSNWYESDPTVALLPDQETESARMQSIPHLPPIPSATKMSPRLDDSTTSDKEAKHLSDSEVTGGGSYLQQHEKKKLKPSYRRYTLEDYKSLKRDINVGGLGPDLEAAKVKMDKVNRAKKYSEFIRQQHKNNAINLQNKSSEEQENKFNEKIYSVGMKERFTLGNTEQKRGELQEKRRKALDYARQVPKPKTFVPSAVTTRDSPSPEQTAEQNQMLQWELLQSLRERHEREKAIVAEITSPRHVT